MLTFMSRKKRKWTKTNYNRDTSRLLLEVISKPWAILTLSELHKREKEESSCFHCFENKKIPSHQLISLGDYTYLMLPSAPLCPGTPWVVDFLTVVGHCLIAPIEHSTKGLPALETNQWNEVEKFMKGITKMNYKMGGCGTIFMETNINMKKGRHTVLECFRVEAGRSASPVDTKMNRCMCYRARLLQESIRRRGFWMGSTQVCPSIDHFWLSTGKYCTLTVRVGSEASLKILPTFTCSLAWLKVSSIRYKYLQLLRSRPSHRKRE